MKPKELAEQLVAGGAAYQYFLPGGGGTVALGGLQWHPNRVRWCGLFPEHQSHVHETLYDKAKVEAGGLGVGLYRGKQLVGYLTTIEESGLDTDTTRDAWAEWQHMVSLHNNAVEFEDFLKEAI